MTVFRQGPGLDLVMKNTIKSVHNLSHKRAVGKSDSESGGQSFSYVCLCGHLTSAIDGFGGAYFSTCFALEGSGAVFDRKVGDVAMARPIFRTAM